jgi:hypothetical protein
MKYKSLFFFLICCILGGFGSAAETLTENVVLLTVDGVRWQELFGGIDRSLLDPERNQRLLKRLYRTTAEERRELLMPSFWKDLAPQGVVLGNRLQKSRVDVTNPHKFSYPGYAEILLGEVLPEIDSNDSIYNRRETVLEFVRRRLDLGKEKVAAFASWAVFHHICVHEPGSIFVSAGRRRIEDRFLTPEMKLINQLQFDLVTPWDSVRHDGLTGELAIRYLKQFQPRLLYIAFDETDDWGHDGRYDRVISALEIYDRYFKRLWNEIQSNPAYKDKTTLIITTDHGRGRTPDDWTDHGSDVKGAEEIWLAVFGPDTPARGEVSNSPDIFQNSLAATILKFLGLNHQEFNPDSGRPIDMVFR